MAGLHRRNGELESEVLELSREMELRRIQEEALKEALREVDRQKQRDGLQASTCCVSVSVLASACLPVLPVKCVGDSAKVRLCVCASVTSFCQPRRALWSDTRGTTPNPIFGFFLILQDY
jgi:hypothetical protein